MHSNQILLILLFNISFIYSYRHWIPDETCQYRKTTKELRNLITHKDFWHITHSCLQNEMDEYSLKAPKNLRWSLDSTVAKNLWYSIAKRMANKKIVFVGDSVIYQVMAGIVIYLDSIGIKCTPMDSINSIFKCSTGMVLHRPIFSAKLTNETIPTFLPELLKADIGIVNVGLHYGFMECTGPHGDGVCGDVYKFFQLVQENITNQQTKVRLAWMDTFRPHFPSKGGSYIAWKNQTSGNTTNYGLCGKINEPMSYDFVIYKSSHLVKQYFPNIPIITTYDMMFDRYDIHLGILTHNDPTKLDCVHLCYQVCFWEAISFRIGKVVNELLKRRNFH